MAAHPAVNAVEPDVTGECQLRRRLLAKVTKGSTEQASSPIIVYTKKGRDALRRILAVGGEGNFRPT
jgi:hypothetical protein